MQRKYFNVPSENVHIASDYNHVDCRFPVQSVIRPHTGIIKITEAMRPN